MSRDDLEKDIETLFGGQTCVVFVVGTVGFLEAVKDLDHPFHRRDFST
jgi:hypothetical protein